MIEVDFHSPSPALRLLETGHAGAHVLAWDENRGQLLVAHAAAGGVAFVEPESGQTEFLEIAPGTEALWIDRDGNEAWVTAGPSGELSVLDLEWRIETIRIDPDCAFPIDFAAPITGQFWVACFGSSEIVAMNAASRKVVDRIALPDGLPYASLPINPGNNA